MLDTRKARVTNTTDVLAGLTADVSAIQTEIEVLRSAALLGRAVDKIRLDQEAEFADSNPGLLSTAISEARSFAAKLLGNSPPERFGKDSGRQSACAGHRLHIA